MGSSKKTNVIVWSCIAAAAGGVAAIAAVVRWKQRSLVEDKVKSRLRDVQEVLADCYKKINEIETHLPELVTSRSNQVKRKVRASRNASPAYDG